MLDNLTDGTHDAGSMLWTVAHALCKVEQPLAQDALQLCGRVAALEAEIAELKAAIKYMDEIMGTV